MKFVKFVVAAGLLAVSSLCSASAGGSPVQFLPGLVALLVFLCLYFLPTAIAHRRRHRNTLALGALNLLLGWTLLGWVAALVWALMDQPANQRPM